jgi:hypothetical protein
LVESGEDHPRSGKKAKRGYKKPLERAFRVIVSCRFYVGILLMRESTGAALPQSKKSPW